MFGKAFVAESDCTQNGYGADYKRISDLDEFNFIFILTKKVPKPSIAHKIIAIVIDSSISSQYIDYCDLTIAIYRQFDVSLYH